MPTSLSGTISWRQFKNIVANKMNWKILRSETVYLLDSDVLSFIFQYKGQQPHLERRILSTPVENLFISIISVDEALKGVRMLIDNPRSNDGGKSGCLFLRKIMRDYSAFEICPYSPHAAAIFRDMPAAAKRRGTNDCKIAAIALSNGFTVITRNVEDYRAIPSVQFEDWTREEIVRR